MKKMELKQLVDESMKLFEIDDIKDLGSKLMEIVTEDKIEYYKKFRELVKDLSVDWLQKIFQYYEADRKDKKQDYTPLSLARFVSKLVGDGDTVLDMCAGSGALTIQKWNLNKDTKFICEEFSTNVIPFLLFNLAIRNIDATVVQKDVLGNIEIKKYKIIPREEFGKVEVQK